MRRRRWRAGEERCFCGGPAAGPSIQDTLTITGAGTMTVLLCWSNPSTQTVVVGVVAVSDGDGDEWAGVDDDRGGHEPNSSRRIAL